MGVTSGFIFPVILKCRYDELVNCLDDSEWLCPNCRSENLKDGVTASPLDVK